ncbi:hypothetical protein PC116_g27709 [Phytophthora cactorum]|nr:hypothetical protein PC116_g27709 [Phytophthora cactorum]
MHHALRKRVKQRTRSKVAKSAKKRRTKTTSRTRLIQTTIEEQREEGLVRQGEWLARTTEKLRW